MNVAWDYFGAERRSRFEDDLSPRMMALDLEGYQEYFGKEFGINEWLKLQEIRAKGMIAEAIGDFPEFLVEQVGKMRNSNCVDTIAGALAEFVDLFERFYEDWEDRQCEETETENVDSQQAIRD